MPTPAPGTLVAVTFTSGTLVAGTLGVNVAFVGITGIATDPVDIGMLGAVACCCHASLAIRAACLFWRNIFHT